MGYVEDLRGTRQGRGRLRWRVRYRDPSGHERAKSFARKVEAERFLRHVEADKLKGVGGGGASQLRSSRCSVLHLASCHHQTGVPTGSSAADGRLQPIGVNAGACQEPRDQRV
jgi:hypothetical protein